MLMLLLKVSRCASMKVPALRRGNISTCAENTSTNCLNESPRPKAGKSVLAVLSAF